MAEAKSNGLGIASLVLGIISLAGSFIYGMGLLPGILGLIFAIMQKKKYPNGVATAGLITSIIGLILSVLVWILIILVMVLYIGAAGV